MTGSISVVVPTHRRPQSLRRCLEGLDRQSLAPREVVVVHAKADDETPPVVAGRAGVRALVVDEASLVAGMARGAAATTGDIVCFTDDDAVPRPDWLSRIASVFSDPSVGAVGGRDAQPGVEPRPATVVGSLGRWGKLRGNHHLGEGAPREVDVLKGVNMAFRRGALALPTALQGSGAESHNEVAICLWARSRGWRIVYEPWAVVDHAVAPRVTGADRISLDSRASRSAAFNLSYAILSLRPDLRLRRSLYASLVGDRGCPGLVSSVMRLALGDISLAQRMVPTLLGTATAVGRILLGGPLVMVPLAPSEIPQAAVASGSHPSWRSRRRLTVRKSPSGANR